MAKLISDRERDYYARVGRRLERARKCAGLTQTQVAEHLGITFQQLQKYESGENRVPVFALSRLCTELRVTLDSLGRVDG